MYLMHHFLLVGTKADLRTDSEVLKKVGNPLTKADGEALAKELGARCYVECSALTQDGLKNVFDESIRAALNKDKKKDKKLCMVL